MFHLLEEEQGDSVTEMQTVVEDAVGRVPRGHIMKALWIQTRTWEFVPEELLKGFTPLSEMI